MEVALQWKGKEFRVVSKGKGYPILFFCSVPGSSALAGENMKSTLEGRARENGSPIPGHIHTSGTGG